MRKPVFLLLVLSTFLVAMLPFSTAPASGLTQPRSPAFQPLQIVAVFAADTTPYDQPLTVRILVTHDPYLLPEVSILYMPILQNRTVGPFWRISSASLAQSYPGLKETLYEANVPNLAWGDKLPAGTIIVYYAEAHDATGSVFTALQEDRLNPYVTDDKLIVRIVDLKPPSISNATIIPDKPVSGEDVSVTVSVTDGKLGSGVATVTLYYSIDNGPFTSIPMALFEDDEYTATVPAQQSGRKVTLYLIAIDKDGNKNSTRANMSEYVVQKSAEEIAAEQLTVLVVGSVLGVIILVVAFLKRRTIVPLIKGPQAAFSICILLVFIVAVSMAFALWQQWALWWWDAVILLALVNFWALVDPRTQGTARPLVRATFEFGRSILQYLSKMFQENPPTILVAAAYVLGFGGAICDFVYFLATRDIRSTYALANLIAEYVFILLALGVIGQLIFLARKRQDSSQPTQ